MSSHVAALRLRTVGALLVGALAVGSSACGVSTDKLHYLEGMEPELCVIVQSQGLNAALETAVTQARMQRPDLGLTTGDVTEFLEPRCDDA